MNIRSASQSRTRRAAIRGLPFLMLLALLLAAWAAPTMAESPTDSCVDCHSDANFFVTNKKLYDYYQLWSESVHGQEQVGCHDCHNGNPKRADKAGAHGRIEMAAADKTSPVNYRNVPQTCAQCHDDFYDHYRQSSHYKESQKQDKSRRGPNCVTCHGSVNTAVLNVNTVRRTCEVCHNEETENHPDIPGRAESLLNKFLSMQRFYRYLSKKERFFPDGPTLAQFDDKTSELYVDWHSFELENIEKRTVELLALMKRKRTEIKQRIMEERK